MDPNLNQTQGICALLSLTEDDHLCLSDLGVEPGLVLGGDLAAVGARRPQRHLLLLGHIQEHPQVHGYLDPNLNHTQSICALLSLTEDDHLCLADLGVEPGRVLGGDLAAVGARRRQGDLLQQHPVDAGLTHLK